MHSSSPGGCARLGPTLHTPAPRVHYRPHPGHAMAECTPRALSGRPWGSLPSAPVARVTKHVPWPVKPGTPGPLIGTHCHAPRVTRYRCLTASNVSYTLLWTTLWRSCQQCHIYPALVYTLRALWPLLAHLASIRHPWPVSDLLQLVIDTLL